MEENTSRAEAERLLGIAEKLLHNKDFQGSKDFAILSQETEPLLDGSDQILAVTEVHIAADRRINNHRDWYGILQVDRLSDDLDVIKRQYRRLALLLHPDKNKFAFADSAFKLVADAWAVLSDSCKKSLYDNELSMFSKIDPVAMKKQRGFNQPDLNQHKLPVRRTSRQNTSGKQSSDFGGSRGGGTTPAATRLFGFWTACPYCYNLYEYPRVYEGCCLRCQNCVRAFHAAEIPSLPPVVPGKDAYYCCWGFFPMGFALGSSEGGKKSGFPNWMPPIFPTAAAAGTTSMEAEARDGFADVPAQNATPAAQTASRKRGRPRKNV